LYNTEGKKRIVRRQEVQTSPKSPVKRVFLVIVFAFLFAIIVAIAPFAAALSAIDYEPIKTSKANKGLSLPSGVVNIAIFGLDAREEGEDSRSDTILILSIDKKAHEITLCSILRDTFVTVPGHSDQKINGAYFYGGPALAVDTINKNFDLNIKEYVTLDFQAISDIVDAIGGVEMEIEKNTVSDMNTVIKTTNRILGGEASQPVSAGIQTLDGHQAVAYARMRNSGAADFDRTERQRLLFAAVAQKIIDSKNIFLYMKAARAASQHMTTSLGALGIAKTAAEVLPCLKNGFELMGLTKNLRDKTIDGQMVLFPSTLEDMAVELHEGLYGDNAGYSPTAALCELSAQLSKY